MIASDIIYEDEIFLIMEQEQEKQKIMKEIEKKTEKILNLAIQTNQIVNPINLIANKKNIDAKEIDKTIDLLQNIMKNPAKIMGLVKSVGDKLQSKIDSGEMNQHDLFSDATELMSKMKNVPGMDNIQGILEKMGGLIPGLGKNVKVDTNAMETKLKKNTQMMAMRERMKKNMETKTVQKALEQFQMEQRMKQQSTLGQELSIDELVASLGFDDVLPSPTSTGNGKKQKCDKKNKKKMDGDKK